MVRISSKLCNINTIKNDHTTSLISTTITLVLLSPYFISRNEITLSYLHEYIDKLLSFVFFYLKLLVLRHFYDSAFYRSHSNLHVLLYLYFPTNFLIHYFHLHYILFIIFIILFLFSFFIYYLNIYLLLI